MSTSFEYVKEVFEQVYQKALADKGVTYMESQATGYLASSRADLAQYKRVGSAVHGRPVDGIAGPQDGTPVAWVLDPAGLGLVQVNDGVSEAELTILANKFYGL